MANNNTSGAVHLTSLDLDITKIQKNIQTIQSDINNLANLAVEKANIIKQSMAEMNQVAAGTVKTGTSGSSSVSSEQKKQQSELKITKKVVEDLALSYAKLNRLVISSKIDTSGGFRKQADEIRKAAEVLDGYRKNIKSAKDITEEMENEIRKMSDKLKGYKIDFENLKTSVSEAGRGFLSAGSQVKDLDKQTKRFIDTTSRAQGILTSMAKNTKLDQTNAEFVRMQKNLSIVVSELYKMSNNFTKLGSGGATKEEYNRLQKLEKVVAQINLEYKKLQETATRTGVGLTQSFDVSKIDQMILKYSKFATELSGKTGKPFEGISFDYLVGSVDKAIKKIRELKQSFLDGGTSAKEAEEKIKKFSNSLDNYKTTLENLKREQKEQEKAFVEINKSIQGAISSLKSLEKTATFKQQKEQVADLRAKYQKLYEQIRSKSILPEDAKKQVEELNSKFTVLSSTVKTGISVLQKFTDKVVESVKWRVAHTMITLIYRSFTDLIKSIRDTEDAIIELQRVLNDPSLSTSAISDQLHDLAYEYGRTFEEVNSTAIRFSQTGMNWDEVLSATEATMLGLNVTELKLSTATEGLIAVLTQFGIEAEDLNDVINKINITSDKFPVTAEKIVAALQRTGAAAAAAKMTLEDTISIITAMSEATGRSGENIGTALNSIIAFTSRESSIETFANYLKVSYDSLKDEKPIEIWKRLGEAIKDNEEAVAEMMATNEEFSELLNSDLAESMGLQQQYNDAIAEEQDLYGTVGMYRRTYFISLLNNMQTVVDAFNGMANAEGYSIRENEKSMEALSKRWNQLVITLHDLAVEFGEAGFLDFLKFLAVAATDTLKLIKSLGGLKTVLVGVTVAFAAIKRERIGAYFNDIRNIVKNFVFEVGEGKNVITAFSIATKDFKLSVGQLSSIIGIAVLAIYAAVKAFQNLREESIKARKELIESAEESKRAWKEISSLYEEYSTSSGDEREEQAKKIIEALGYEEEQVGYLIEKYGELEDGTHSLSQAIEILLDNEYEKLKLDAELAKMNADPESLGIDKVENLSGRWNELSENEQKALYVLNLYGEVYGAIEDTKFYTMFKIPKSLEEAVEESERFKKIIEEMAVGMTVEEQSTNSVIQTTKKYVNSLDEYIEKIEKINQTYDITRGSRAEYEAEIEKATQELSDSLSDIPQIGSEVSDMFEKLTGNIDSFQEAYSSIMGVIDEYNESGKMTADMLQTILELEPEYLQLLEEKNGELSVNKEKLDELIAKNDVYMGQLVALRIEEYATEEAERIRKNTTEDMTEAEIKASTSAIQFSGDVGNAAMVMLTGRDNGNALSDALNGVATKFGLAGNQADVFKEKVMNAVSSYKSFLGLSGITVVGNKQTFQGLTKSEWQKKRSELSAEQYAHVMSQFSNYGNISYSATTPSGIGTYYTGSSSKSKSGGGGSKSSQKDPQEEAAKKAKEAYDDLISTYEHAIKLQERNGAEAESIAGIYQKMIDETNVYIDKFYEMGYDKNKEYIMKLEENIWQYEDEIKKVIAGIYDAEVKARENRMYLLEQKYESAQDRRDYSYMSENLKEQLAIQKEVMQEAHKEAQRLRKEGVDENDDAIQECIKQYWDARDKVREINSQIEDTILSAYEDFVEMSDSLNLWEYYDFSKIDYLENKLDDINKLLREGTITLKRYNELIKEWNVERFEAQKSLYEKEQTEIEENSKNIIKAYETQKTDLNTQKDDIKQYYDTIIDSYEKEIETWEKRKKQSEEYYDTLIDNLQDVEKSNERINKQVDYFNDRQKIITNIEQAQARSGVEWRQKEMEYQQQLTELDESWNRTIKEWDLQDQISQLQELKEIATSDIDATIEKLREQIDATNQASDAAVKDIENRIEAIDKLIEETEKETEEAVAQVGEKINDLSKRLAEAIQSGTKDGIVNSEEEIDKAVQTAGNVLIAAYEDSSVKILDITKNTAVDATATFDKFFKAPVQDGIYQLTQYLKEKIQEGATTAAKGAASSFQSNFIAPIKTEMANLMRDTQPKAKSSIVNVPKSSVKENKEKTTYNDNIGSSVGKASREGTNVFISNNFNDVSSGIGKTKNIVQKFLSN